MLLLRWFPPLLHQILITFRLRFPNYSHRWESVHLLHLQVRPTVAIATGNPTALHGKSAHPTWILDSGANNHMTGELSSFTSPFTHIDQSVRIADGSSIPIHS